jgi:hypothetical protein
MLPWSATLGHCVFAFVRLVRLANGIYMTKVPFRRGPSITSGNATRGRLWATNGSDHDALIWKQAQCPI